MNRRITYRAETGSDDPGIETALDGAIKSISLIQSSAANMQTVKGAVQKTLEGLNAVNSVERTKGGLVEPGEDLVHPAHTRRIGAQRDEGSGIPGEISVLRIADSVPPAVVVTAWLR